MKVLLIACLLLGACGKAKPEVVSVEKTDISSASKRDEKGTDARPCVTTDGVNCSVRKVPEPAQLRRIVGVWEQIDALKEENARLHSKIKMLLETPPVDYGRCFIST